MFAATRRFDADNTLTDLLNFIRSLPAVPEGALTVENVTTRPARAFDPEREGGMSLRATYVAASAAICMHACM